MNSVIMETRDAAVQALLLRNGRDPFDMKRVAEARLAEGVGDCTTELLQDAHTGCYVIASYFAFEGDTGWTAIILPGASAEQAGDFYRQQVLAITKGPVGFTDIGPVNRN